MKKVFSLIFLTAVLFSATAFGAPSDNSKDPVTDVRDSTDIIIAPHSPGNDWFPLDLSRIMYYDNNNAEVIGDFKKVRTQDGVFTVFIFKTYNHIPETAFFTEGQRVYQWKPGWKRLWYDFGASPGDKWNFEWVRFGEDGDTVSDNSADAYDGAIMNLVALDEKVTVPAGEYESSYHFRLERPGVADAAYTDEWFAKGVGCVMREWDSIAGPQQMKLTKIYGNTPNEDPVIAKLRLNIALDNDIYSSGDDLNIEVSVLNWTDTDITLNFNSGLQIDYIIDGIYRYSEHNAFTEALSTVVIPANEVVKWNITHKSSDYALSPGKHYIQAEIACTGINSSIGFGVLPVTQKLPVGIAMKLALDKDTVSPGEQINFTLTATNNSGAEQTLDIVKDSPLKYEIGKIFRNPGVYEEMPKTEPIIIPAGGSVYWTGSVNADNIILMPGNYTLYAGLWGYGDWVSENFTVSKDIAYGTLSGIVYAINESAVPVADVKVTLQTISPWKFLDDVYNLPVTEDQSWSTITDAEGKFSFSGIPVGAFYLMDVYKEGYYPYQNTIRMVSENETVKAILKEENTDYDKPLNYKNRDRDGIAVTIGTGASVYQPGDDFKAVFAIRNKTDKTVTFDFDSEALVAWSLAIPDGEPVALYTSTGGTFSFDNQTGQTEPDDFGNGNGGSSGNSGNSMGDTKNPGGLEAAALKSFDEGEPAKVQLKLEPQQMVEFIWNGTFKDIVPEHGGKYVISARLLSKSSTIEDLAPSDLEGYVKVLVVPSESVRIEAQGRDRECVVDLVDSLKAFLDMNMKSDNISGQVRVSEMLTNHHNEWRNNNFIKMIEVDADSSIRSGLDSCLVRIYFNKGDYNNPNNLVIAHWRDNISEDDGSADSDSTGWEELNTRIDTVNGYVEAYTTTFSSFGLFEKDIATAIENEKPGYFALEQNLPNPFNPSTVINFTIPQTSRVRLTVYNMLGQEVTVLVDGNLNAGNHSAVFDARRLSSGLYFYTIDAGKYHQVRKMTLLK